MQLVLVPHRCGAAFEIAHVAALFGDYQRALELAGIFGIDAEIGAEFHRAAHAFRHIDEGAIGKDRAVERREEIVMLRHDLAQPFLHQFGIFLDGFADRQEDDASLLQLFAKGGGDRHAVEYCIDRDLARALDTGKHFLLCHRYAELVVNRLDVRIELVERGELFLLFRCRVVIGVLVIDGRIAELGPVRLFHFLPQTKRFQPPVEHPFRLALLGADEPDGVFTKALFGEFGVDFSRPAVFVFGGLFGSFLRFAILNVDIFAHAISLVRASWVSGIAASAPRNASLTTGQ